VSGAVEICSESGYGCGILEIFGSCSLILRVWEIESNTGLGLCCDFLDCWFLNCTCDSPHINSSATHHSRHHTASHYPGMLRLSTTPCAEHCGLRMTDFSDNRNQLYPYDHGGHSMLYDTDRCPDRTALIDFGLCSCSAAYCSIGNLPCSLGSIGQTYLRFYDFSVDSKNL
jgi:hypothetical protein